MDTIEEFLRASKDWIVDGGSLVVRYIARTSNGRIVDASLTLGPRKITRPRDFSVKAGPLIAGQKTFRSLSKDDGLGHVDSAIHGHIQLAGLRLELTGVHPHSAYSEMLQRDRWAGGLHLQISGQSWNEASPAMESLHIDNELRAAKTPFDGINDLCSWLALRDTRVNAQSPAINIRIGMPIDAIFEESRLSNDVLTVGFIAQKNCDLSRLTISTRTFPGEGLKARARTRPSIAWLPETDDFKRGVQTLNVRKAESVLLMVSYAGQLVRRQWFIDPDKATNRRLLVLQAFDKDLKQLKQGLLETTDAARFERAVIGLLFLLGFNSSPVLETQAPDVVVFTPAGSIAIVECTTKIADFGSKIGKLVDRRNALMSQLEASGNSTRVLSVLISSQPKAQVAAEAERLSALQVVLLTREDIIGGLERVRIPENPESVFENAVRRFATSANL